MSFRLRACYSVFFYLAAPILEPTLVFWRCVTDCLTIYFISIQSIMTDIVDWPNQRTLGPGSYCKTACGRAWEAVGPKRIW